MRAIRCSRGCVNVRVCMSSRGLKRCFDEVIKPFRIEITIRIASRYKNILYHKCTNYSRTFHRVYRLVKQLAPLHRRSRAARGFSPPFLCIIPLAPDANERIVTRHEYIGEEKGGEEGRDDGFL